jgi:PAS domain S-box-containing protein
MNTGEIITLITAVGAIMIGILTFINQGKLAKTQEKLAGSEEAKTIIDGAVKVVPFLSTRIELLESENQKLYTQMRQLIDENKILSDKISFFERALLEKENPIYRNFFEIISFACLIVKAKDGTIYDGNGSFCRLYGYGENELKTMTIYDITLEKEETENAINNKVAYVENRLHKNKNNDSFNVEIYATYYDYCGVSYILCIYLPK